LIAGLWSDWSQKTQIPENNKYLGRFDPEKHKRTLSLADAIDYVSTSGTRENLKIKI